MVNAPLGHVGHNREVFGPPYSHGGHYFAGWNGTLGKHTTAM